MRPGSGEAGTTGREAKTDCYNSATVNASAHRVWAVLRGYHDTWRGSNVCEHSEAEGDSRGPRLGTRRIVNGAPHETLIDLDERALLDELLHPVEGGVTPSAAEP